MLKKNVWEYVRIGTNIRYLQDAKEGLPIYEKNYITDNIKGFLDSLSDLNLNVTRRGCFELDKFYNDLLESKEGGTYEERLTKGQAKKLGDLMNDVRKIFAAEAKGVFAYFIPEHRYSSEKLMESVDDLFGKNIFNKLPTIAQYDFQEAGKCIALARSTAAAFHILRGTESVLEKYYKKYTRKKPNGLTWGQMLNTLKSKASGALPSKPLLDHLTNIKDSYRNPTQHPEMIYDIDEVQDLFNVCIDVVNKMIKEL